MQLFQKQQQGHLLKISETNNRVPNPCFLLEFQRFPLSEKDILATSSNQLTRKTVREHAQIVLFSF